jgi:hypothetical protein
VRCQDIREIGDSYLSDELEAEPRDQVAGHLASCAQCQRELAARRQLRSTLRASFAHADALRMRDEFADNLRVQLRAVALRKTKRTTPRLAWLAMAACLLLALAFGLTMTLRQQGSDGEEPALRAAMAEISRTAAGDHANCAIKFQLSEKPIPLEEAGLKYDRSYLNLGDVVNARLTELSGDIQLVESHSCVFNGRRFAHVVLKEHGSLISLLITDLSSPEIGKDTKHSKSDATQQLFTCPEFEGYQVACFKTASHAIFLVSDLAESENLAVARLLAPTVCSHVSNAESPLKG